MREEFKGYELGALGMPTYRSGYMAPAAIAKARRKKGGSYDDRETAGAALKQARKGYGLTGKDAAFVLGVEERVLRSHEAGQRIVESIQDMHARLVVEMEGKA